MMRRLITMTLALAIAGSAQDARSETFPLWSPRSTRNIDPRVEPNAGIRIPLSYFPIEGGPLLYHAFSPATLDFDPDQPTSPWSIRASIALLGVDGEHRSSKFQEYRDVRSGATVGVEGHYRVGDTFLNVLGRQLGRRDQDMVIDGGEASKYLWNLSYNETPHNYAFGAKSLWSGIGTSRLSLPDAMQADLQNSANITEVANKLLGYVNSGAQSTDLGLLRRGVTAEMTLLSTYPFVIKASGSNESRDGVRPWSASFGFFDFVEIPWTVQYDTRDARLTAEYAKPESRVYANVAYRYSNFVDHVQSLTFDNPFRIDDSPGTIICNWNCGPATGRMSLYPSNNYNEVSGTVVVKDLPLKSVFDAYASAGFMRQNEALLPFSTNSADPQLQSPVNPSFNVTDPAGLPRRTAEAAMNTETVSLRWTASPTKKTSLLAQYRLYHLDNREKQFTIDGFVREDQDIRYPNESTTPNGTFSTLPIQYTSQNASLEGTYYIKANLKATAAYTFDRMDRDFREVARADTNKGKLTVDYRTLGAVDLKTSYEYSKRTTSPYDFSQDYISQGAGVERPVLPWLEKFDEAPYSKNEAQVMATVPIGESMSVSSHAQVVTTDYGIAPLAARSLAATGITAPPSKQDQFGVRWNRRRALGADFTYAPSEQFTLFVDAGYERIASQQEDRQWIPGVIGDPYSMEPTPASNSNWTATARDNYYTGGCGLEAHFTPKLKLTLQYTYSKSDGSQKYQSPIGTPANDANPFAPVPFNDVDNTRTQTVNPELEYKYSDNVSISAGYHWEEWRVNDYNYNGFTYAPLYSLFGIQGTALLMGGLLPKPYSVNVAYVRMRMGF